MTIIAFALSICSSQSLLISCIVLHFFEHARDTPHSPEIII